MSPLTVAVVTPTLNQAGFIRETIDSVLGQGYPGLEYRVMDGGSTDGTLEILQSYGSALCYHSGPDAGQSDAINRGWRDTTGEIVAWLNSDDLYLPGALQRVADFFEGHPEVDLAYGDCKLIDAAGRETGRYPAQPFDYATLLRSAVNYIPQPAAFFRRRLLDEVGELDPGLHYTMDFDYWLRAGLRHQAAYLPIPLASLRLHGGAKSAADFGKFSAELVRTYTKLFAMPDLPPGAHCLESEAMSSVYYLAADGAFWAGQLGQARAWARQSLQSKPRVRSLWLWLALGRPGRWMAGKLYPNPYLPGGVR